MVVLDAHLSFTDDEEGVSSGSLSNDVLSIFVVCLSGESSKKSVVNSLLFHTRRQRHAKKIRPSHSQQMKHLLRW